MAREGVRVVDLLAGDFPHRVETQLGRASKDLPDAERLLDETRDSWPEWRYRLKSMIVDTAILLNDWIDDGQSLLFEGAQA